MPLLAARKGLTMAMPATTAARTGAIRANSTAATPRRSLRQRRHVAFNCMVLSYQCDAADGDRLHSVSAAVDGEAGVAAPGNRLGHDLGAAIRSGEVPDVADIL